FVRNIDRNELLDASPAHAFPGLYVQSKLPDTVPAGNRMRGGLLGIHASKYLRNGRSVPRLPFKTPLHLAVKPLFLAHRVLLRKKERRSSFSVGCFNGDVESQTAER